MNPAKRGAPREGTPSTGCGLLPGETIPTIRQSPPKLQAKPRGGRRSHPEQAIQRSLFDHLRWRGVPGLFAFHPANGGWRTKTEAKILKELGVTPGVPDVIAIYRGRCYALELKAEGGRATPKQLEAIAAMEAAGAYCCIAEGLDRAIACLEAWGILRGPAS